MSHKEVEDGPTSCQKYQILLKMRNFTTQVMYLFDVYMYSDEYEA